MKDLDFAIMGSDRPMPHGDDAELLQVFIEVWPLVGHFPDEDVDKCFADSLYKRLGSSFKCRGAILRCLAPILRAPCSRAWPCWPELGLAL